jgi:hypothetical protein
MSSLPLISHHLFVAAIEDHSGQSNCSVEEETSLNVELEVVDCSESLPENPLHSLTQPKILIGL